jgi:hypothetical protein
MRGTCRIFVEATAALIAVAAGTAPADPIDGLVLDDHSGSPVGFAEVRVFHPGDATALADLETDSGGRFRTPDLSAGEYRLEISKPNYVGATLRFRVEHSSGQPEPLSAKLVRCGTIAGQVIDREGQPLSRATVFAMKRAAYGALLRPSLDRAGSFARVNETGSYRLYNLAPGRYAVAVAYGNSTIAVGSSGAPEAAAATGSGVLFFPGNSKPRIFDISSGDEYWGIDFAVVPSGLYSVSGKVESPDSRTGFWLALITHEQPALAAAVTNAEPNGSFRFDGIPPGSYDLLVAGPAMGRNRQGATLGDKPLFGRAQVEVGAMNVGDLTVEVQPGRPAAFILRAAGTSAGGANCAVAAAKLRLQPVQDWAAGLDRLVEVTTAKSVRVDGLAPGAYHLALEGLAPECRIASEDTVYIGRASDSFTIKVEPTPAEANDQ